MQERLSQIEKERDIQVLFATEGGSRLYGSANKDSDYDVRFIYKHNKLSNYISIGKVQDNIEIMEGEYDFNGWDIRKMFKLMSKGNPHLYEWLAAPPIYRDSLMSGCTFTTYAILKDLYANVVEPRALLWHYLNLAKGNFKKYIEGKDNPPVKKLYHIARALHAVHHLVETNTFPPIKYDEKITADYPIMMRTFDVWERQIRELSKPKPINREYIDWKYYCFVREAYTKIETGV